MDSDESIRDELRQRANSIPTPVDNQRPTLSRQSSGCGDEWVLVNSSGCEVENSGSQADEHGLDRDNDASGSVADDSSGEHQNVVLVRRPGSYVAEMDSSVSSSVEMAAAFVAKHEEEGENLIHTTPARETAAAGFIVRNSSSDTESEGHLVRLNGCEKKFESDWSDSSSHENDNASGSDSDSDSYEIVSSARPRANTSDGANSAASFTDELPVNFVQLYSNRIRNYIHLSNLPLNWKLSLLAVLVSAAVIGLGVGHFVGSTHTWWTRNRIHQQQLEQLKGVQDNLVECLRYLQTVEEKKDDGLLQLRRQLSDCRTSGGGRSGFCLADDKPTCAESAKDLNARLADCSARLESCQARVINAEENVKQSADDRLESDRQMKSLDQELQRVKESYRRLSALSAQRGNELRRRSFASRYRLSPVDPMASAVNEEQYPSTMETTAKDSSVKQSSNEECQIQLRKSESDTIRYRQRYETCQKERNGKFSDADNESGDRYSWESVRDALNQLKNKTKLDEILSSYMSQLKELKFPALANISELWVERLADWTDAATNAVNDKIDTLEKSIYAVDWDEYARKAYDVGETVGATVRSAWEKAKVLTVKLHDEHTEKILKKTVKIIDDGWGRAKNFWNDMSRDFEEAAEPEEDEETQEEHEQDDIFDDPPPVLHRPLYPKKIVEGEAMRNEIRRLRNALKSSAFSRYVVDEFADYYLRRLKYLLQGLAINDNDRTWWTCQKYWWVSHPHAHSRDCSGKLLIWQRHIDSDIRPQLIGRTPQLRILIDSFTFGDQPDFRADRSSQKQRGDPQDESWLHKRWKSRDTMRRQATTDPNEFSASKWLFRRGKERERQRAEYAPHGEYWHHRRRQNNNGGAARKHGYKLWRDFRA